MDTLGSKERKIEVALKGSFPLGHFEGGLEATTCPMLTRGRGGERTDPKDESVVVPSLGPGLGWH